MQYEADCICKYIYIIKEEEDTGEIFDNCCLQMHFIVYPGNFLEALVNIIPETKRSYKK
jgi:hypothetical protein